MHIVAKVHGVLTAAPFVAEVVEAHHNQSSDRVRMRLSAGCVDKAVIWSGQAIAPDVDWGQALGEGPQLTGRYVFSCS